jgi:hypothetical protein
MVNEEVTSSHFLILGKVVKEPKIKIEQNEINRNQY